MGSIWNLEVDEFSQVLVKRLFSACRAAAFPIQCSSLALTICWAFFWEEMELSIHHVIGIRYLSTPELTKFVEDSPRPSL